jgi:hypothetical protein
MYLPRKQSEYMVNHVSSTTPSVQLISTQNILNFEKSPLQCTSCPCITFKWNIPSQKRAITTSKGSNQTAVNERAYHQSRSSYYISSLIRSFLKELLPLFYLRYFIKNCQNCIIISSSDLTLSHHDNQKITHMSNNTIAPQTFRWFIPSEKGQ